MLHHHESPGNLQAISHLVCKACWILTAVGALGELGCCQAPNSTCVPAQTTTAPSEERQSPVALEGSQPGIWLQLAGTDAWLSPQDLARSAREYVAAHHGDFDLTSTSCGIFLSYNNQDHIAEILFSSGIGNEWISVFMDRMGRINRSSRGVLVD